VTEPRYIAPHATYAICRRTERRRFLLRPDAVLNQLFVYVLALFAKRFGVQLHVATVMSTHFHLVVTVPNEDVSELMHRIDMHLACALQVLRKYVGGVVWAPGKLSIVPLETREAVVEQIAYAIANPVKAGLVYRSSDWPGVTATIEDLGRKVLRASKPAFYFLGLCEGQPWAPCAEIQLTWPACLREIGEDRARELVRAELERREIEARAFVKLNGWSVMGRVACMNVSPYRCAKSWEELGKLVPHIAAGRGQKEARLAAIARLVEFRQKHREAKARWVAGDRSVVFPAGTYWMRVHHGAAVAPFE
jgi:REP element-mobilizing transposase RayT